MTAMEEYFPFVHTGIHYYAVYGVGAIVYYNIGNYSAHLADRLRRPKIRGHY